MADRVIETIENIITDAGGTITEHPKTVVKALEMLDATIAAGGNADVLSIADIDALFED